MGGGPYAGGAGAGAGEEEEDDDMDLLELDEDPDAMDWQPTTPARLRAGANGGAFQSPIPISPLSSRTGPSNSWAAWGNGRNGNGGFDEATGLENLLARTNLADLDGSGGFGGVGGGGSSRWGGGGGGGVGGRGGRERTGRQTRRGRGRRGQEFEWRWVYVASLVPLTVAAYIAWRNVRGTYEY